jgi:nucleoside-diphosphate-sugar epimerase
MRILVTGHRGYIGSVLAAVLQHRRHEVFGLDAGWFEDCNFGRTRQQLPGFNLDVRDVTFAELLAFDAVVHLAALSDDASADLQPDLTRKINHHAAVQLARACREARIARFIFASTCSVYGAAGTNPVDEDATPNPLSQYARAKRDAEREILALAEPGFSPVVLRFATAYGVSPGLRLDLVVNDFVASAVTTGRVVLGSAGHAWRPLVHVEDAARAVAAVLDAPDDDPPARLFNVVAPSENHRVIDIADAVTDALPHCSRTILGRTLDERSYRVEGSRFLRTFPSFSYRWTLPSGIRQLCAAFAAAGLTAGDCRSDRFRRRLRLAYLIENARLDPSLRRPLASVA